MDDQQYEEYLKKLDDETRPDRVRRRREISPAIYGGDLPELLWAYSGEAIKSYIWGEFSSVILFCASILELVLADKLIRESKGTKEVIEMLTLNEKTRLCYQYKILKKEDKKNIDKVRELRNWIAHANAGRLSQIAKRSYGDVSEVLSQVLAEFYLSNLGGKIQRQALECLEFTRGLSRRWYGEKLTDADFTQR